MSHWVTGFERALLGSDEAFRDLKKLENWRLCTTLGGLRKTGDEEDEAKLVTKLFGRVPLVLIPTPAPTPIPAPARKAVAAA